MELVTVMALLATLAGISWPALRHARDQYAVRAARDALAAGLTRTRIAAVATGGARLVVDLPGAAFWIETADADTIGRPVDLGREFGVTLTAGSTTAERVQLRFDGLGIGRMTSRTFHLQRGTARVRLTVSAYGRIQP